MTHDLRTTLSPIYADLLKKLLSLLPRSISPPVLTCLLETLSSLFRYLLIPSLDFALLDQTWDAICEVVPKCLNEVQSATAEVWGSCLRRMKKEAREKSVVLLAERTGDIENTSAWTLVFACKACIVTIRFEYEFTLTHQQSVSQTLHTSTTSIFLPVLDYYLSTSSNTNTTYTLIRRSLTALIHHVKNAEQFELLGDLIVQNFFDILKSTDISSESDIERLRKMIEVVGVVCSVRQGSRLNGMLLVIDVEGFLFIIRLFSIPNFAAVCTLRCSPSYNTLFAWNSLALYHGAVCGCRYIDVVRTRTQVSTAHMEMEFSDDGT